MQATEANRDVALASESKPSASGIDLYSAAHKMEEKRS